MRRIFISYFAVVLFITCATTAIKPPQNERTCEKLGVNADPTHKPELEMCRAILQYDDTGMPNSIGQETQTEAFMTLKTFLPLIHRPCSKHVSLFLCTAFFPMCNEKVKQLIGPCRPVCEVVRRDCSGFLQHFGFNWPSALNCSLFVPRNEGNNVMCMLPEGMPEVVPTEPSLDVVAGGDGAAERTTSVAYSNRASKDDAGVEKGRCVNYKNNEAYVFVEQSKRCAPECKANVLWSASDKEIMEYWLAGWTSASLIASIFVMFTFAIAPSRFHYPERTIVYLSVCQFMICVSYLIRLIAGRDAIACDEDSASKRQLLIHDGFQNAECAIVFLLHYYFSSASVLWWVIQCACLLAKSRFSGLFWSQRENAAVRPFSHFFHFVTWCVPAALTIAIVMIRDVSADELTGFCEVGRAADSLSDLRFVFVPYAAYIGVALLCLMLAALGAYHARNTATPADPLQEALRGPSPLQHHNHQPRSILAIDIHWFSLLFLLAPTVCLMATSLHAHVNRRRWESASFESARPDLGVELLRTFMTLVTGVTCAVWICSREMRAVWKDFFFRTCCYKKAKNNVNRTTDNIRSYNHLHRIAVPNPYQPSTMVTTGHHPLAAGSRQMSYSHSQNHVKYANDKFSWM